MKKVINKYSDFVSSRPYLMMLIVVLISIFAAIQASNVQTESMDYQDLVPDDYEVIRAFDILGTYFGGTQNAMIMVETEPSFLGSKESRDMRDPEIISYINLLSKLSREVESVTRVTSASTLLTQYHGSLPRSKRTIIDYTENNAMMREYISSDNTVSIISLSLSDDYDADDLVAELNTVIRQVPKPSGVKVELAGDTIADPIVQKKIGPDMGRTSNFSLIGILIVLILLFRTFRYSVTPLAVIAIGVLWAFGYLGLIGMGITSATSGVISMIMGIGIDFGIQTVTRFKQELKEHKEPEEAMRFTMNGVLIPMATTTISALIGFKAMGMGELTLMADFGQIMSYGITSCFLVAVTLIPALLIITERLSIKRKQKLSELKDKMMKKSARRS